MDTYLIIDILLLVSCIFEHKKNKTEDHFYLDDIFYPVWRTEMGNWW